MRRLTFKDLVLAAGIMVSLALLVACGVMLQPEEPVARTSQEWGWMREEQFTVTAAGAAGSAVGSQASDGYVRGHLYAVHLDFASGISSTTDFKLATTTAPTATVLSLADTITDGWYYPVITQTIWTAAGTSTFDRFPTNDRLTASVASSTATDAVTVTVHWGQ